MNIIVGLDRKADTFINDKGQSVPYDNTIINFITDTSRATTGFKCCTIKVKTKILTSVLACDVSSLPLLLNNKSVDFILDLSVSPPAVDNVIIRGDAIQFNEVKK